MFPAMFTGVAGMSSHSKAMAAVADNIANVSTVGFKGSRANFGDIMARSLTSGGSSINQAGSGSRVIELQQLMTQGSFETTDISTDLAIAGKGFFQVRDEDTGVFYTRAGQFRLDDEGFIVNPSGLRLQGYNVDADHDLQQVVDDLQILTMQADANATSVIDLSVNLDAADDDTHHPSQPITPSATDSWNYMTTVRIYDSLGVAHDMSCYFQRLSEYDGSKPTDSAHVWKVGLFENVDGTVTANPAFPDNIMYLHFDTDGNMVGSSTGQPAYADQYTAGATFTDTSSVVTNRIGETLTFTPTNAAGTADAAGAQVFHSTSTVSIGTALGASDSVTLQIGSYNYTLTGAYTTTAAASALADAINADNEEYWAMASGSDVILRAKNTTSATAQAIAVTTDTTGDVSVAYSTLADLKSAINDGLNAVGMAYVDANPAANWTFTIGGTTLTEGTDFANGASAAATATNLAAAISALADYTATADGQSVYITYTGSVGSAGNVAITSSDTTNIFTSGTNLMGGMDGDTEGAGTNITASGTTSLTLTRTDGATLGEDAVISIASTNSLGDTVPLDFDSWTHDTYAADAEGVSSTEANGERTFSLTMSSSGATSPQTVTLDFSPTGTSASTQTAGASETFYLYQDGFTRGSLQSLSIDRDGLITGQYSNGTVQTLGAVVLTNFQNPTALQRRGDALWEETIAAGAPTTNRPSQGGLGELEAGSLESANVDLASEFVKMITFQRAFQANSRIITTSDEMLAEVINLKR